MRNAATTSRPGDGAKPGGGPVGRLRGARMPGLGPGGNSAWVVLSTEAGFWPYPTCALGLTPGQERGQIRTSWNEAPPPVRQPPRLLSISSTSPVSSGQVFLLKALASGLTSASYVLMALSPQLPNLFPHGFVTSPTLTIYAPLGPQRASSPNANTSLMPARP